MVRISELHESDDDSMERLNLDGYNSDLYDEYLSNNMEATPSAITEVRTTTNLEPPSAPPAVTVTIQLEDEPVAEDLYERRRVLNQKYSSGASVLPIVDKNSRATTTTTQIVTFAM